VTAAPPWTISDATSADIAELVALDQRNFPREDWFNRRVWRRILGEQGAGGQMLTLVARHQGAMVGAIVGEFRPRAGRTLVWSIAVDAPLRGSGLAQHLMAELLQRTPSVYRQVGLEVRRDNLRARRFYERLGFRPVREIPHGYPDGTDAIQYQASLDELRRALAPRASVVEEEGDRPRPPRV
jgi:ribosomal protein S18 acetylase RimI-like enzyme